MADETRDIDLADATRVRVLETVILHASDVIYWLDGSSASVAAGMTRIAQPLDIVFSVKPRAIKFLHSPGKTAFWSQAAGSVMAGEATEAQRARPASPLFNVVGEVHDPAGRFNPAAFELTLGSGTGHGVVLYPAPVGVNASGILQGRVLLAASQQPLVWALLTVDVDVGMGETISFSGQTNAVGDFRIALKRLPPLPLNTTEFSAQLRIAGDPLATAANPVNPAGFNALNVESATQADTFSNQIPLAIRPGEIKRINSVGKTFIAVKTV